jgi:TPR repeat protein
MQHMGDHPLAAEWYKKAAAQGLTIAQYNLGYRYEDAWGAPEDYALAMDWYQKAAAQGDTAAQVHIGYLYEMGHGVPQDYSLAMEWYLKALDGDDSGMEIAYAQLRIGLLHKYGLGVAQDETVANEWFAKSAKHDYGYSDYDNGTFYEYGNVGMLRLVKPYCYVAQEKARYSNANISEWYDTGVKYDEANEYGLAAVYYELAAVAGHAQAQNNLGFMYEYDHVDISTLVSVFNLDELAAEWYTLAANQGLAEAQYNLGSMYLHGNGVPKDKAKAIELLTKAAEQGHNKAQEIAEQLQAEEIIYHE